MGNQHSRTLPIEETENSPSESEAVVGTMQSQYASINNAINGQSAPLLPTPIQVQDEGEWHQNRLVMAPRNFPLISLFYPNSGLNPKERLCRISSFLIFVCLFLCSFVAFAVFILIPQGITLQVYIQGGQTTILSTVDPFYFDAQITRTDDASYNARIGIVPYCSKLVPRSSTIPTVWYYGHVAKGHSVQKLEQLNQYAYLLTESSVNIYINITDLPVSDDNQIYLYILTDYSAYIHNQLETYFKRYKITPQKNRVTTISFRAESSGFYFYTLALPNGTNYNYGFDIKRLFYNQSDFNLSSCVLSSKSPSCQLQLNSLSNFPNGEELCILSFCTTLEDISDNIFVVDVALIRKPFNSINCSILTFVIAFFMLTLGIAIYDSYRKNCDKKLTTYDTCICKKKRRSVM